MPEPSRISRPLLHQLWTAYSAKHGLIGNARAQPYEFGTDHVCAIIVAVQITLRFQMCEKTISRALIDCCLFGNVFQAQPCRRGVKRFQESQDLGNNTDRR